VPTTLIPIFGNGVEQLISVCEMRKIQHKCCIMGNSYHRDTRVSLHHKVAFRYSLQILKIYSARNVYYRFAVLTMNIGTQLRYSIATFRKGAFHLVTQIDTNIILSFLAFNK